MSFKTLRHIAKVLVPFLVTLVSGVEAATRPVIPAGWVQVDFFPGTVFDTHSGHHFDQIMGPLVEDKLIPRELVWLKPTYGNQNILWFSQGPGQMQILRDKMIEPFRNSDQGWKQRKGQYIVNGAPWQFVELELAKENLQIAILVCRQGTQDTAVLYWGTESSRFKRWQNWLLYQISPICDEQSDVLPPSAKADRD